MVRRKRDKIKYYIAACFTSVLSIGAFYLPVFVYYLRNPQVPIDLSGNNINNIFPMPTQYFIPNSIIYSLWLIKTFSLNFTDKFQVDHLIAAMLITFCLIYYFFTQKMKLKITVFIGICFIIIIVLFASLFSTNTQPLRFVYLTFGIFTIIITEIVTTSANSLLKPYSKKLRFFIVIIIFFFLIKTMSSDLAIVKPNKHPERLLALNGAVASMEQEIARIKAEKNFPQPNFFQIVSFTHTLEWNFSNYTPLNTVFFLPLEKNLQIKLAKTDDSTTSWGLKQINDDYYIFLVCIEYSNEHFVEDCTGAFSQSYPNHRIIKNIYTKHPLSVYLTQKVPIAIAF